jgi:geranylgeranyl pyrophosphate synthase
MDLAVIFAPVAEEMKEVDRELKALMRRVSEQTAAARGRAGILEKIVQHPFAVPGKRIRPALVLLTTHAAAGSPDHGSLIALSSAVEVLHAASLVHDDIIDGAEARRHQVSLNKRFGNRVAVLAGDILYTHFFSLVTGLTRVEPVKRFAILDTFLDTTKAMCAGEILAQEAAASGQPLGFGDYLEIAKDKTAVLFAACFRTAALLCDLPGEQQECLGAIGMDFGMAFQMADDLVDGDHGLGPEVDLKAEVLGRAERTRGGISTLAPGRHRDSLRDLVDYVITPAIS